MDTRDYLVDFATDVARRIEDGEPAEPSGEGNVHFLVRVRDRNGQLVPDLTVCVTITGTAGNRVGPLELPFLWADTELHYGADVPVPGSDDYLVSILVAPGRGSANQEASVVELHRRLTPSGEA